MIASDVPGTVPNAVKSIKIQLFYFFLKKILNFDFSTYMLFLFVIYEHPFVNAHLLLFSC